MPWKFPSIQANLNQNLGISAIYVKSLRVVYFVEQIAISAVYSNMFTLPLELQAVCLVRSQVYHVHVGDIDFLW